LKHSTSKKSETSGRVLTSKFDFPPNVLSEKSKKKTNRSYTTQKIHKQTKAKEKKHSYSLHYFIFGHMAKKANYILFQSAQQKKQTKHSAPVIAPT